LVLRAQRIARTTMLSNNVKFVEIFVFIIGMVKNLYFFKLFFCESACNKYLKWGKARPE